MRTPGPARWPARAIDFVGAFHRLDRHDRLVLHGDGLADVERGDRVRHPVAEREIRALLLGRRARGQHAVARQQRREERGRIEQLDAVVAHHVGHRGDQRVGVARLEPRQHRQQRQVGNDAGEDLDVLDLPGHDGPRHAGRLQDLDALAELAERDPVQVGAGASRAACSSSGNASSLTATTVTSWPRLAGALQREKRKPAVAGDEADACSLSGRWPAMRRSSERHRSGRSVIEAGAGVAESSSRRTECTPTPLSHSWLATEPHASIVLVQHCGSSPVAASSRACDDTHADTPTPVHGTRAETFTGERECHGADHSSRRRDRAGTVARRHERRAVDRRLGLSWAPWTGDVSGRVANDAPRVVGVVGDVVVAAGCAPHATSNGDLTTIRPLNSPQHPSCSSRPDGRTYSSTTSSSRRLGRRRPTPRLDVRMKSTRYCTSSQCSDGSRSICASARLVFECSR